MTSHREAPRISKDPTADNTDVYAWRTRESPDSVTLIANYIPLEEPAGGPNFHSFDDEVLYAIKIDNNGDGIPETTYEFRFRTEVVNPNTFLYNTGPILFNGREYENLNVVQTYSVTRLRRMGHETTSRVLAKRLLTPPANIGPVSTPNYEGDLVPPAIHDLPDLQGGVGKAFAGPRKEGFAVDLGSVFDLLLLRPFAPAHLPPPNFPEPLPGVNATSGYNVHTVALQLPIKEVTRDGRTPTNVEGPNSIIGVWATAGRYRGQIREDNGNVTLAGSFQQVSRLGMPLVNEVFIPLPRKDEWNATEPKDDAKFATYFLNPEPAVRINQLYGIPVPPTPRADLEAIFLTGFSLLPAFTNFTGPTRADMLRLNLAVPPSSSPDPLGILGGDLAGFPNGRRPFDDVGDIELRAAAGATPFTPDFVVSPNKDLSDGVRERVDDFLPRFPYLATPHQGFSHEHDHS